MMVKFTCDECGTDCEFAVAVDDNYGVPGSPVFDTVEQESGCSCWEKCGRQLEREIDATKEAIKLERWM